MRHTGSSSALAMQVVDVLVVEEESVNMDA